jgi:RimJ/RimL family protein N-acetyltransferase
VKDVASPHCVKELLSAACGVRALLRFWKGWASNSLATGETYRVVRRVTERRTRRLVMRRWRASDLPAFADMNADPEVMEHFPAVLTRGASDAFAARADAHLAEHDWGLWAIEVAIGADRGRFAGFTGLAIPSFQAAFTPCVEVGWRLARWAWGHGYATEAAAEALRVGFAELGLTEVVSFTAQRNIRSQAVMHRLGMQHNPADDFDHPAIVAGQPTRRHVVYRLPANRWQPPG